MVRLLPPAPVPLTVATLLCLMSRRCIIRIATGTTPASAVPSAFTPWPVRPLCPRMARSCATSAPLGRTPPGAKGASRPLWQVLALSLPGGGRAVCLLCHGGANFAVSCFEIVAYICTHVHPCLYAYIYMLAHTHTLGD